MKERLAGWTPRAAQNKKKPGSRIPAAASCLGRHAHPAGRSPNSSSLFLPLAAVVAVAQGLFYPPDYSAGRCCSNPPLQPLFKADKTETPVPGSDTGVLGGRGWIRTTEAEKQQIYSLSPLATREHAQILFTSVAGRLVYFIRLRAICQLLFSDFCSFSAEAVDRISFGSDVSGARNPARRQWLRRT